jgi:quercetin dioxygenase-like cupin family protein
MSAAAAPPYLVRPADGHPVPTLGMVHKVEPDGYGGALFIAEGTIPPGMAIFPHTHTREDECALVLAGELMYEIGDAVFAAPAGSYVRKPRGIAHAFWNAGSAPARVMEIHTPGGMAGFYDELGELFATPGLDEGERRARWDALAGRYGLINHWERVPGFLARHGLTR